MKEKGLIKRLKRYMYDSSISLRDRAFIVFSIVLIAELIFVATPIGALQGEPLSSTLSTLAGAMIFAFYIQFSYTKKKLKSAKIVVSVILVFIFLPLMFFTNGGVYSGMPVNLLLGGMFINMILEGKLQAIMNILYSIMMISCWIIGYYNPQLVTEFDKKGAYIDSISGLLIVNVVIYILLRFHSNLYERENEIAKEKSLELEEMNKAQNRFFSSMSHEIRTPINTVLGLNEIILRQEDASDEIRKDARNIQGAGKMLLALINDILDISKMEAGKMDIVPVNYNVSSVLSEIVNMIWLKADEKGLKFTVDIDPDVPEILFGDEVRIKQILINLLNNAVKYTAEGSVALHMECEKLDVANVVLKISVADTGMGIKPDALPHLFDTFKRVDEEKNRYIEGTGLGLSIVKQLVELMGGEINVNSVYGQGSVFSVNIKQGISSGKGVGDISITGNGDMSGSGRFEHKFRAPGAKILIVDDNEMNLEVEKKLLEGTEIEVDTVLSAKEALALTLGNRYDVIFMDHLMPEIDGIECYEMIRNQKGGLNTDAPIIVLTANAGGENIELYNNTGFDGYLLKPVSGHQLEDTLISFLPLEKVVLNEEKSEGMQISTASAYARKKPVIIATSTMTDLPANVIKKAQISIIPYYVGTNEGVFLDNIDIDSEELVRYMSDKSKMATSEPPTEEALTQFFSEELKKAHHLIYITLTKGSSREYGRAINAAKTFDNVTVINSENMSSGTGILVMIAAKLASQGLPVDKIVSELEAAKKHIQCSFVIKNTDVMARRERISPFMNGLLNALWLRPMLKVSKDRLGVGKFLLGSIRKCYEKYIKYALPQTANPDKSFAFITYAGMSEEDLLWVVEQVKKRVKFENIIIQKASAGISSNCGEGTFGIIYITSGERKYNLVSYFAEDKREDYEAADIEDREATVEQKEDTLAPEQHEEAPFIEDREQKWYDKIHGIDSSAALKNSGSEESFLSVLRIYYDSYPSKSEELDRFYETDDLADYTIKVHALKSSSRLVGALRLAEAAEALEMAGGRADRDYISSHHDEMMKEYRSIYEGLSEEFGEKEDLPPIPEDVLKDAYNGLVEFSQVMDYELAKMVLDSVKEYSLPKEDEERFDKIQVFLSNMEWEKIIDLIKER